MAYGEAMGGWRSESDGGEEDGQGMRGCVRVGRQWVGE